MKQIEYPPVIVNQESTVIVKYPNGLEPSKIESSIVTGEGYKMVDFKSINIENNRLSLPQEPGKYSILMQSAWKTGTTSYIFVVEVK
ncbi:hypothetical protein SAMN03159341_10356 [Paenibacillus sp. 1_12]|nr:hypothetical protein SAMN03159341_10356 [Paenibacillus sp. 1_12]